MAELTGSTSERRGTAVPQPTINQFLIWGGIFAVGVIVLFFISHWVNQLNLFPESWNLGLRNVLNEFKRWVVVNRNSNWLFVFFFEPLSAVIDFLLRRIEDFLLWLPWPVVVLAVFVAADRIRGLRLALLTALCLLPMGMFGLWEESMQTLSLMVTAVLFSLVIGVPLGIWSAQNDRVEQILRPILDAMQTMPAYVYLIPVLLFFGVARVPSIIATVIYALPPAIRLTSLGLRSVPEDAIEAAQAFGSTERQILRKVRLPLALPTIMVGVNQTIMMALSIVVIASLIGAGGLGDVVLKALRRLQVGSALEAGLAIVLMAVLLDRVTAGLSQIERHSEPLFQGFRLFSEKRRGNRVVEGIEQSIDGLYKAGRAGADWLTGQLKSVGKGNGRFLDKYADAVIIILTLVVLSLLLRLLGVHQFPRGLRLNISQPVDALVKWMQVNLYDIGGSGIGTGPLRDFLIIRVFQPLTHFLAVQLPWIVVAFFFVYLAFMADGWKLALVVWALMMAIGFIGMWPFAMDTLGQTLVAVIICVVLGIPLGIWASHSDRADRAIRPILDFLQTIPIFVYLVPVIMLFGTGSVAGLIASVLYAAVPVIRLTNAGIRGVDETLKESAAAFGSTWWQTLAKVEIPIAFPSVMLGINQTIMMVLAMVIIAGLVGATGLGLEVYQGFANDNLGRSVEAGLAIVLLAIVIDRITQKMAHKASLAANVA
ncbi:MAG: ABC transporter permease subunit [Ardenticatenaceae bacterium]|nr:ABC transporter permease subunit [Ardenticatenaceae bacterium]MCB9445531.1 ABC transporter permease subunit [Ardenticatenaceae bacterium]